MPVTVLTMQELTTNTISASGMTIGIVVSRYHRAITESMEQAAVETFVSAGGKDSDLSISEVPGSFELTAACRAMASKESRWGRPAFDAIVALGCLITGETTHDQFIAQSVVSGLTSVIVKTGVPIAFGVLTCQSMDQAKARTIDAAGAGGLNKGAEAMRAAIETVAAIRKICPREEIRA